MLSLLHVEKWRVHDKQTSGTEKVHVRVLVRELVSRQTVTQEIEKKKLHQKEKLSVRKKGRASRLDGTEFSDLLLFPPLLRPSTRDNAPLPVRPIQTCPLVSRRRSRVSINGIKLTEIINLNWYRGNDENLNVLKSAAMMLLLSLSLCPSLSRSSRLMKNAKEYYYH